MKIREKLRNELLYIYRTTSIRNYPNLWAAFRRYKILEFADTMIKVKEKINSKYA